VDLDTKELNGDFIDPSIDEVEAGLVRTLNIEMAEIGAGEMFADYAAINERTMDYTVITTIPSDIILVRAKDLFAILNKEEIEAFRKECRNYPSDEELRKKYYSQRKWNEMRLGVIRKTIKFNVHKDRPKGRLLHIYKEPKTETEKIENDDINTMNSLHLRRGTLSRASIISSIKGRGSVLPPISSRSIVLEEEKDNKGRSKSVGKFSLVKPSKFWA